MLKTTRSLSTTIALAAGLALTGAGTAVAAPPASAGKALSTTLTAQEEVAPFVGVDGASGQADLRLIPGQGRICVDLTTSGLDLVLAHIHEGAAGTNGGVVVDFTPLVEDGAAVGCVAVDRELVRDIVRDPAGYYVNTHQGVPPSAGFFEGIRGQLG